MTSQPQPQPLPPPTATLSIDDFFDEVTAELRQAEILVEQKAAELAEAREQLAAARGKVQLLSRMQQAALTAAAALAPGGAS